jgi:hypothetical protein
MIPTAGQDKTSTPNQHNLRKGKHAANASTHCHHNPDGVVGRGAPPGGGVVGAGGAPGPTSTYFFGAAQSTALAMILRMFSSQ